MRGNSERRLYRMRYTIPALHEPAAPVPITSTLTIARLGRDIMTSYGGQEESLADNVPILSSVYLDVPSSWTTDGIATKRKSLVRSWKRAVRSSLVRLPHVGVVDIGSTTSYPA